MAVVARTIRSHRGFEGMYRRHVPSVYRYTLAVLGNQADAEDATQQTFLSAYKSWDRGERPRRPHNWLIAIAHNVCRQRFRERSRRPAEVALETDELPSPEVDQLLGAAEIRSALEQLAFNQRAALVMRELGGISYRDIAGALGITESAVETLLFRARRALREQLEGDLTCGQAEAALSRRLDGRLAHSEAAALRAHLRGCRECATLERSMRARRGALRGLAFPLPPTLTWSSGSATVGGVGLLAKGAAVVAIGAFAAGVGTKALEQAGTAEREVAGHVARVEAAVHRSAAPVRRPAARRVARPLKRHTPAARPVKKSTQPQQPPALGGPPATAVAAVPAAALPVAAPVATAAAPTAQAVAAPLLGGARTLEPVVDSPAIETSAVTGAVETVAAAVTAPLAVATPAAGAPVPSAPTTVTVPQLGTVTGTVTKLTTP
ncbi:MAG TPA: sigma-70 family RNA polymerase sigma factor [Solirubrobacteraceae bacterium]